MSSLPVFNKSSLFGNTCNIQPPDPFSRYVCLSLSVPFRSFSFQFDTDMGINVTVTSPCSDIRRPRLVYLPSVCQDRHLNHHQPRRQAVLSNRAYRPPPSQTTRETPHPHRAAYPFGLGSLLQLWLGCGYRGYNDDDFAGTGSRKSSRKGMCWHPAICVVYDEINHFPVSGLSLIPSGCDSTYYILTFLTF